MDALQDVCAHTALLIGCDNSLSPLVALRPSLGAAPAVLVAPAVLDLIGWENLGRELRLLAVLTEDVQEDCLQKLLPSKLPPASVASSTVGQCQLEREGAALQINGQSLGTIMMHAFRREKQALSRYDRLALAYPPGRRKESN